MLEASVTSACNVSLALVGLSQLEEGNRVAREVDRARLRLGGARVPIHLALDEHAGGALRELGDAAGARAQNLEAFELAKRSGFPPAAVASRLDLVYVDLMEGDVGAADAAFPELQTAVESTKGFHQWLWSIRIATARAEAALLGGRPDRAEEHAREALAYAERIGRRKYVCRARTALGQALLELGRLDDAVGSLEGAAAEADALGHLPSAWSSRGAGAGGGGARATTPRERRRIAREPTSRRSPPG